MSDLSAVVRQLKKERANAHQMVARLDAALRALKHLGTGNCLPSRPQKTVGCRPEENRRRPKSQVGKS